MGRWRTIPCLRRNIQLMPMLLGGQSFRWTQTEEDSYIGVLKDAVWELKQNETEIQFKSHSKLEAGPSNKDEETLKQYLRLDVDLRALYDDWSKKDNFFKKSAVRFFGVRMLNQEVTENVFSFICSSNNNITRIASMVEKLCKMYGTPIAKLNGIEYHSFPKVSSLADPKVEAALRTAGFGYRAKFIYQTACKIHAVGEDAWVKNIKSLDYHEAKGELMTLSGIGAKVADCICLMSLGHLEAIPVDTHVFQIASNQYLKHLKERKSVTDKIYNEIGDYFRELFGPHAGWAHTILFCDDLKSFKGIATKRKRPASAKAKSARKK